MSCVYLYFRQDLGALRDISRELLVVQPNHAHHVSESYGAIFTISHLYFCNVCCSLLSLLLFVFAFVYSYSLALACN
jgi:hypothetical protein